jgi:hypothetical protein
VRLSQRERRARRALAKLLGGLHVASEACRELEGLLDGHACRPEPHGGGCAACHTLDDARGMAYVLDRFVEAVRGVLPYGVDERAVCERAGQAVAAGLPEGALAAPAAYV